jgi:hypothetical protein
MIERKIQNMLFTQVEFAMSFFNCRKKNESYKKVANIDELPSSFVSTFRRFGWLVNDIQGCTEEEIIQVENKYGMLPILYKEMMMKVGKGFGISRGDAGCDFFMDDIIDVNYIAKELEPEDPSDIVWWPKDFFAVYDNDRAIYFILLNEDNYDSPVFVQDYDEEPLNQDSILVKAYDSLWDWINAILEDKI